MATGFRLPGQPFDEGQAAALGTRMSQARLRTTKPCHLLWLLRMAYQLCQLLKMQCTVLA